MDEVPATIEDLEELVGDLIGANPTEVGNSVQDFLERYVEEPETAIDPITSIGLSVVGVLGALTFMLLTAFFIAVRPDPLVDGLVSLFPPARRGTPSATSPGAFVTRGSVGWRAFWSTRSSPASCSTWV